MTAELTIRRALPDDAGEIADVQARSREAAYRGLVPDEAIEQMVGGRTARTERIRALLDAADEPRHFFVAIEGIDIVGMAVTSPSRDPDATSETGELVSIYLAPEAVGRGIGRALHDAAMADLRDRGFTEATLWVLRENERARRFYEAARWTCDGATKEEHSWPGGVLHEVRYRRTP